jgi:hypothetical protein
MRLQRKEVEVLVELLRSGILIKSLRKRKN